MPSPPRPLLVQLSIAALVELLRRGDSKTRRGVLSVLEDFGPRASEAIPVLEEFYLKTRDHRFLYGLASIGATDPKLLPPLIEEIAGRMQVDIDLFLRGGLQILTEIERIGYRVWETRPVVRKSQFARLFVTTSLRHLGRRIAPRTSRSS